MVSWMVDLVFSMVYLILRLALLVFGMVYLRMGREDSQVKGSLCGILDGVFCILEHIFGIWACVFESGWEGWPGGRQ